MNTIEPKFYQAVESEPGYNLHIMRIMSNMSVLALAKASGVHRQTIAKIEKGMLPWDRMPMGQLIKLFAYFGQRLLISFESSKGNYEVRDE